MKLRTKYILFIVLIHLTTLVLSYFIFEEQKLLFIGSEIILLCSLYFSYQLYQSLVKPIELINSGTEAIKDQDFTVKFQKVGQSELDQLISTYNQMIDQLRQERTLKAQKHFFLEKLIQTSPTGIIILDLDGRISIVNPKAQALLQQLEGTLQQQFLKEIEHPLAQELVKMKKDQTQTVAISGVETYKIHKAHFIDQGFPKYFLMIEELTNEKLQIEKQAYGKVIRMMAHEVNNSIGPINSILQTFLPFQEQLPEDLQEDYQEGMQVAINRNERLNQFMKNFAKVVRLPAPQQTDLELQTFLEEIKRLYSYQLAERSIQLSLEAPEQPIIISADKQQLEQVLINIIKNAIEAIPVEGHICMQLQASPPLLSITDNGVGLPEDFSSELFSPFFSTKPTGQGIGLTLTKEILLNHDFRFALETNAEGNTVFWIAF